MPVNNFLMRAVLEHDSLIPRDRDIIDLAIAVDSDDPNGTIEEAADCVARLFSDMGIVGQGEPLGYYISQVIPRGIAPHHVDVYELNDLTGVGDMGSPIYSVQFAVAPTSGTLTLLPAETSMVVTTYAIGRSEAPVKGPNNTRPKQRRTGHIYFGPLNADCMANVGGEARFSLQSITDFGLQMQAFLADLAGAGSVLGVWSRVDAIVRPVFGGHVDDAPDTQRRRGVENTRRFAWEL